MKGIVESTTKTLVHDSHEDAFDVTIKLEGQDDLVEFRTVNYDERYASFWAKPGTQIEIDITSFGRLRFMEVPFFKYLNK